MIVDDDPLTRLFTIVLIIEATGMLLGFALLLLCPGVGVHLGRLWRGITSRVAGSAWRSCGLVFCVSVVLCAGMALVERPVPRVHDEFAYLLAGETYAWGRWCVASPPAWRAFETPHEIVRPVYASKYPPAQGAFLAMGFLLGAPILGVWLSTGLMSAAVCWALRAWTRPAWALAGGLLVASTPGVITWWGHTYWGGSVAALGGALLYGAMRRLWDRPRAGQGAVLALGLIVLANSRPFEGLIASVPVGALLAWRYLAPRRLAGLAPGLGGLARVAAPAIVVLAIGAAGMGTLNERTTGDPLKMAYTLHAEQYGATPMFIWQTPGEPASYTNPALERFYVGFERKLHRKHHRFGRMLELSAWKVGVLWGFFVGPSLTLALVVSLWAVRPRAGLCVGRERWLFFAVWSCVLVVGCSLTVAWLLPHYVAPLTTLLVFVALAGLRAGFSRRPGSVGPRLLGAGLVGRGLAVASLGVAPLLVRSGESPTGTAAWARWRAATIDALARDNGADDLVLIDPNAPWLSVHHAAVYNPADIEDAPVLFAWASGPGVRRALRASFPDRTWWRVAPGADGWRLVRYPERPRAPGGVAGDGGAGGGDTGGGGTGGLDEGGGATEGQP